MSEQKSKQLFGIDIADLKTRVEAVWKNDPLLKHIGNTPMFETKRLTKNLDGNLTLKLEGFNPSGSLKDRPAMFMVVDALTTGKLGDGMSVLEASSGNMASALSFVCKRLGVKTTFVLGNTITREKRAFMDLLGSEILLYDGNTWESAKYAKKIADENPDAYYFSDQFRNPANIAAHYLTTGPEILRAMPEADVFVCSMGSAGSLCGIGRCLKESKPDLQIVGVSAETGTRIPGLRNLEEEGFVPPLADFSILSQVVRVNEKAALRTVADFLEIEGFLLSPQGAAVVSAARGLLESGEFAGKNMVALIGDASWKNMDVLAKKSMPGK